MKKIDIEFWQIFGIVTRSGTMIVIVEQPYINPEDIAGSACTKSITFQTKLVK